MMNIATAPAIKAHDHDQLLPRSEFLRCLERFATQNAARTKEHVSKALAPLQAENAALRDQIASLQNELAEFRLESARGRADDLIRMADVARSAAAEATHGGAPAPWENKQHRHGQTVTHRGGLWSALSDTNAEPGTPGAPWRCLVAGLSGVDVSSDGDQFSIEFKLSDGTTARCSDRLPGVRYRGTHKDGDRYQDGDCVTSQGSLWVARRENPTHPGLPDSGWTLAVKRGSDGKSAKEPAPVRPHFFHEFVGRSKSGDIVNHNGRVFLCLRETHEAPDVTSPSWVRIGA